ncbi:MAG: anaerobic dehydrogenase, typically selenocysteine-containing, partial [Neobacillus sp.]|nr:anaerobic dehydrogenase, typically selenocysteine-containing [Neobacillus sp.]
LRNALSTNLDQRKGIDAYRKVDFIVTHAYSLNTSAQYSDIVLPISTQWERHSNYGFFTGNREAVVFPSKVIEPLYESKSDQWIEEELAKRLGMDSKKVYPYSEEQTYFNVIAGTQVMNKAGTGYEPLVTITEKEISEWSAKWGPVKGTHQQGRIGLMELMEQGVYQVERFEGDNYGSIAYQDFVNDPIAKPLQTKSGKFEIYCQTKADWISGMGRGKVKPYPEYTPVKNGYEQSFKDWKGKIKGDYPYQMVTPHYLRRSHTSFDNIPQLREALPNPVYISAKDAAQKGIKDGDTLLVYNLNGKVLRLATISEELIPGCIFMPHGAWADIDEKTGIDKSGSDNILCASVTSACGVSGYNTNLVNFKKYDGEQLEPDCLKPLKIVNLK